MKRLYWLILSNTYYCLPHEVWSMSTYIRVSERGTHNLVRCCENMCLKQITKVTSKYLTKITELYQYPHIVRLNTALFVSVGDVVQLNISLILSFRNETTSKWLSVLVGPPKYMEFVNIKRNRNCCPKSGPMLGVMCEDNNTIITDH